MRVIQTILQNSAPVPPPAGSNFIFFTLTNPQPNPAPLGKQQDLNVKGAYLGGWLPT
jgi:hypothetical protein